MSQQEMDLGPTNRHRSPQQLELDEFRGALRYFPTQCRAYQAGPHLLFVHHYDHNREIGKAHRRLWLGMVSYGKDPDAPGTITVMCVWGVPGMRVGRYLQRFDHRGDSGRESATDDSIKAALSQWEREALD
jgi:hypothetical protein